MKKQTLSHRLVFSFGIAFFLCLGMGFASDGEDVDVGENVIDLPTAMRLAGADHPEVALARERVREAEAEYEAACLRFFPWMTASTGYRFHDGNVQDIVGDVFATEKQSVQGGAGLALRLEMGEAVYQRLAVLQNKKAVESAAESKKLKAVLDAALAWLDLAHAEARLPVAHESIRICADYADQVKEAVRAGLAEKVDQLRVETRLEGYRSELFKVRESQAIAASRLALVLRLNPSLNLKAREGGLAPFNMADPTADLSNLIGEALENRPEMAQLDFEIQAALRHFEGAKYGPLVPTIEAQTFWGGLGGGRDGSLGRAGSTTDYFVGLGWKLGPGGLLDRPRIHKAKSVLEQSRLSAEILRDKVVQEVVEAHSRIRSGLDQLQVERRALDLAVESFELSRSRRRFGVSHVLEFIQSEQELNRRRNAWLQTVTDYNQAQFILSRAIGRLD